MPASARKCWRRNMATAPHHNLDFEYFVLPLIYPRHGSSATI
jgi:hypothetical protein